jgi:DNA processing protein
MIKKLDFIPEELQQIKTPPKQLFYKGNLELLNYPKIAIVGTRKPNQYTQNIIFNFAKELAKNNIVIVSGGALGTDIIAHQGAFPNTISIMANSLDIIYPKTNKSTIQQMEKDALILSEYESNHMPHKNSFVTRNRLISGLADILIIAQADENSGSLRSAEFALKQNKPIYVLPHRLNESNGTNKLIAEKKAKIIHNLEYFIHEIINYFVDKKPNSLIFVNSEHQKSAEIIKKNNNNIQSKFKHKNIQNSDELLEFCKSNPTYDEVFAKFGDKLFEYELLGKIEVAPNNRVIPL